MTPVKFEKYWRKKIKEIAFLQENFADVLPEILVDVYKTRPTDPVLYIAHKLMKYKIIKDMNIKVKSEILVQSE